MESAIRLVTSLQGVLQAVAIAVALYALYELVAERDWRRRPAQTVGRVWVVFVCGTVGIAGLLLGQNAVLVLADRVGAPLAAAQAGFVVSLLLAIFAWSQDSPASE